MIAQAGRAGIFLLAVGLSACSGAKEVILPGERLDLRGGVAASDIVQPNKSAPISLGTQVARANWTNTGGAASHASGHNRFTASAPSLAWSAPIGQGNTRKLRITSPPVAAQGLVAAYDAGSSVSVVSATTGALVWTRDLTPVSEKKGDASGGSLAISGTTLLAATAYGDIVALDLASGTERWRQRIEAAGASGLTAHNGLVYAVAGDSQLWAIDVSTGLVKWQISGPETIASRVGAPAPAVNDRLAVVPFASGDVYGLFRKGGTRLWSASLAGQRAGVVYANVSDITSDPVIVGNTAYMGNQAGRFAAFDMDSGERRWTAREGAYSPASVVGGSVFIVTDRAQLVRLSASTGERIWGQQLPLFTADKPRKHKAVFAHYGPVAAGGKLWVASSDGMLRGFAPTSGSLTDQVTLPAGAAADPIVVGGIMYVLLETGALVALQ
ncbi:PQQ-like beta-propeller repeat protein [Pacificibacter marinus]|uniref:Outer membrane protein assembly factor BamB n=1 Tax=Pacificibacter marinus TaxID=658057 RepID=A0A1Y5RQS6_9RHOB|nr:PQQ-like beta-propeller repeat protein [Pacificibacter marinus]SEK44473.1 Outer membrane protein assembly factor BamB, contains PQQ-like beta-propeller repeat [Pacificibacter marinus]SLN23137.1 Outer membrane protein assembly factor BamB precursor [Pacificibacter marinus]